MHTLNHHLFLHRETSTDGFNSLCTIMHPLRDEGVYSGQIVHGKTLLGTFTVRCDKSAAAAQANIDISAFDPLFAGRDAKAAAVNFEIAKDGYVVFYATKHHDGVYVTLTRLGQEKAVVAFDSRKLRAGDLVAIRPVTPGEYTLSSDTARQRLPIRVKSAEGGKYPALTKLGATQVTLTDKGFEPARVETWPVQAVVVRLEVAAALTLTAGKADVPKPETTKLPRK